MMRALFPFSARPVSARAVSAYVFIALAVVAGCGPNRTHPMRMPWDADAAVPPLGCVPDLDGRIEARELTPSIGTPVSFLVAPLGESRDIDLVGADLGGGERRWDFGADYATDRVASVVALDPALQWYAAEFPGAEVAVPTDPSGAIDALYRLDDAGFYLLGLASHVMDPPEGRTLLPYATPILLFQLPLVPGAEWISTAEASGTLRGLPYAGRDTYESRVPALGELILPDVTFTEAMRVATRVTVSPSAGAPVVRRQSTFVFECFGQVTSVTAADGDDVEDFTVAAEMRRFGL
jgi:hypothetical protein